MKNYEESEFYVNLVILDAFGEGNEALQKMQKFITQLIRLFSAA